jgi:16S rRNA (guanine1516-N2)-methyltransferase
MKSFVCYAFNGQTPPEILQTEIQRLGGVISNEEAPKDVPILLFRDGVLTLTPGSAQGQPLVLDYQDKYSTFRQRASKDKGPLAKAIGLDKKSDLMVVDGMLGTASDSLLMLSWGVHIQAFERVTEIYLLNWYSFQNFKKYNTSLDFTIHHSDIRDSNVTGDVLYLDPMYPQTRNKRLSKKEMQFFNQLAGKDQDEKEVFDWAFSQEFKRVVIKRPPKAEIYLKPTHSFESKSVRYDMYSFKPLS